MSAETLDQYVAIGRGFLRSVNLEQDFAGGGLNGSYVVTANARQALSRIAEGLTPASPSRAFTVTGPYGVGKSAFAVFLTRLLCLQTPAGHDARQKLQQVDPGLTESLRHSGVWSSPGGGLLAVPVTARRAPAAQCLLRGLFQAAKELPGAPAARLRRKIRAQFEASRNGSTDTRELVEAARELASVASAAGRTGLLIMLDELGKLFEYAARDPRRGDLYILQELAEWASRSTEQPVLVLGFLHQGFEEYAQHLDAVTRREWEKIGGRFLDMPFLEPADQVVRMIAAAMGSANRRLPRKLAEQVRAVARVCAPAVTPPGMTPAEFERVAAAAYPLHPLALVSLPYLFRRFAQNERSLFAYLSSQEPFGLQDFLCSHTVAEESPALVRLPDLFDYFTANFGGGLYRHPHAKRWLETVDILDRRQDLGSLHGRTLKAVGMLNALGHFSHLQASRQVVALALADQPEPSPDLEAVLAELREKSILTYRAFNETFRVWEGSDVDVEGRIAQGQIRTRDSLELAASIRQYLPPRPLVARRHSFERGSLRFVAVAYLDNPEDLTDSWQAASTADAHVAVCLGATVPQLERFISAAQRIGASRPDLLVAVPQEVRELHAAVRELAALRWAWDNTPALRDDRVARREVSLRISEAEQVLLRDLDGLLDPRPEPRGSECLWFWKGERRQMRNLTDVSRLVSDVCDELFSQAPAIRNELIARRSLSGAATAARRNLIERMLTKAAEPLLGLQGYPPERSMYDSVLASTGLHRQSPDGAWLFAPPLSQEYGLGAVWEYLRRRILEQALQPVPLDALFAELAAPPFGVPEGLHPVLLCAFLLVYSDEATLYRQETFLPEIGIADFEVLMRRPELFGLAGGAVSGTRAAVVQRLARGLQVRAATVPVVKVLFRTVRSLPEFAWHTQQLPPAVLALREAFADARSPEQLLFSDLPAALGLPPFDSTSTDHAHVAEFFTCLNESLRQWTAAAPAMVAAARDALLAAAGLPEGEAGWSELRAMGDRLRPWVREPRLEAVLTRLHETADDPEGIEMTLGLVAQRPPRNWTDDDARRFPDAAAMVGTLLKTAAATVQAAEPVAAEQLPPAERRRAQALSRQLTSLLDERGGGLPQRVIRAALRMAAEQIRDQEMK
ncbi:MAG: hypothetical protein ACYC63_00480 [Armatimonadota bacterium]